MEQAFGEGAAIVQQTYTVLAKGVLAYRLQGVDTRAIAKAIGLTNKVEVV